MNMDAAREVMSLEVAENYYILASGVVVGMGQTPAYARLFAQAPAMREALKGLLEAAEFADMEQSPPGYYSPRIETARNILRAIEGEK